MIRNFTTFRDGISVTVDGHYIDLHNFYDVDDFQYNAEKKCAYLRFVTTKSPVPITPQPHSVLWEFTGIDYYSASDNIKSITSLDALGFKSSDDFDHEWLNLEESQSMPDDHILILFSNPDGFIRIHAKESKVTFTDKAP